MVQTEFEELNNNYSKIQSFLEIAAAPHSVANQLFNMAMGVNKIHLNETSILIQANKDLTAIRNFYCKRFYSASNGERSAILARYQELYDILSQIAEGELTIELATQKINKTTETWENNIIFNNVMHFCFAIACALPLAAGIAILPFVLPVIALNFFLGAAILTAASSSIVLALSQCYNNFSLLESTKPVRNNSMVEFSFLNNMNKIHLSPKGSKPTSSGPTSSEPSSESSVDDFGTAHRELVFH